MIPVRVAITDDLAMHRGLLKTALANLSGTPKRWDFQIVGEYEDGQALCSQAVAVKADLITLDIRMPKRDGLTALLFLRRSLNVRIPVLMVSSEDESNIARLIGKAGVNPQAQAMTFEQKLALMAKVEERVLKGVSEPNKINDLLNGCEALMLDPTKYAQHLGANGFLRKPFDAAQVARIVPEVLNGKNFAA